VNIRKGRDQPIDISYQSLRAGLMPLSADVEPLEPRMAKISEPPRLTAVDGLKDGVRPLERG
jgi:hypothetical protein